MNFSEERNRSRAGLKWERPGAVALVPPQKQTESTDFVEIFDSLKSRIVSSYFQL
jgi:hypothetical protein